MLCRWRLTWGLLLAGFAGLGFETGFQILFMTPLVSDYSGEYPR